MPTGAITMSPGIAVISISPTANVATMLRTEELIRLRRSPEVAAAT